MAWHSADTRNLRESRMACANENMSGQHQLSHMTQLVLSESLCVLHAGYAPEWGSLIIL